MRRTCRLADQSLSLSREDDPVSQEAKHIPMINTKDPMLEFSELSGEFSEDGITVQVLISRALGSQLDWVMEVIDQAGGTTTWEDAFSTDREAFDEFLATVERDGLASFLDDGDPQVH